MFPSVNSQNRSALAQTPHSNFILSICNADTSLLANPLTEIMIYRLRTQPFLSLAPSLIIHKLSPFNKDPVAAEGTGLYGTME